MSHVFAIIRSIIPALSSADGSWGGPGWLQGGSVCVAHRGWAWGQIQASRDHVPITLFLQPWWGSFLFRPGLPSPTFKSGHTLGRRAMLMAIRGRYFNSSQGRDSS